MCANRTTLLAVGGRKTAIFNSDLFVAPFRNSGTCGWSNIYANKIDGASGTDKNYPIDEMFTFYSHTLTKSNDAPT